jgi:L-erythrulose 1-phosphate isomerase
MLRDAGVTLVEIGHFERRTSFGETDITVNLKVRSALQHGLSVVLCVGEDDSARDIGIVPEFVSIQLAIALYGVPATALVNVILAYEPGWAIGIGGTSATGEQISAAVKHLRAKLIELYGPDHAASVRIVYGGSVTRETAPSYASMCEVDGLFVGRAASEVTDLLHIIEAFCDQRTKYSRAE